MRDQGLLRQGDAVHALRSRHVDVAEQDEGAQPGPVREVLRPERCPVRGGCL